MRDGWKRVKLGDVADLVAGYAFKSKAFGEWPEKVIKITNIEDGIVASKLPGVDIRDIGTDKLERYKVTSGDYVVAMTGSIGKVGKVVDGSAYINQRVLTIRVDEGADKTFVYYVTRSQLFADYMLTHIDSHSVQANISAGTIGEFEFDLPPLPTQRRIAAVLGALDDKIELNRKMNANLEAQAQALFKSWFVDFEPWGGTMPEGWKETLLSDVADFYPGYSYTSAELKSSRVAMATIKNFERGGGFKMDGFKEIVPSAKLKDTQCVDVFDTVVAHTDMTQNADIVGNAEIVLSDGGYDKLIASTDLVRVLPKNGVSKFLIAALLKNPVFKAHCLGYVNGTTVLHMKKSALAEYRLQLPSDMSILDGVAKRFESIFKMIAKNINESRKLAELRDALLPKLMSGELEVEGVA